MLVALGRQKLATVVVAIRLLVFVILLNFLLPEFRTNRSRLCQFHCYVYGVSGVFSLLRANIKLPLRTVLYILAAGAGIGGHVHGYTTVVPGTLGRFCPSLTQLVQLILSVICGALSLHSGSGAALAARVEAGRSGDKSVAYGRQARWVL